jgi:hypothetical protein
MMATEQKYVTIPNVSFDLEQLLDIIRQLDEPARLRMAQVLTETMAKSQRTTDTKQQAEPDQETSRLRLDWIGCLSDLPNKPTSVELQHQILSWWEE